MTISKEKKDIKPLLLKFGVALAVSFAGFLYSRIRIKRINPSDSSQSPPPPSDSDRKVEYGGRLWIKEDSQADMDSETTDTHDKPCIRVRVESSSKNTSPSFRCSGDKDMLLPEFDQIIREFNVIGSTDTKAFEISEYDEEIESLREKVKSLEEHTKDLESKLFEYYSLKNKQPLVRELQSRLKLSNVESKSFSIKIKSLEADNKRLETRVKDYNRVVSELESAQAKIRLMERQIRVQGEAQKIKEQIMDLTGTSGSSDVFHLEMGWIKDLEDEAEELRKANEKLMNENLDLGRKMEDTQILANSVLEDPEKEELSKIMVLLREENAHLTEKIEILQSDRCADAEELVYLRWINACLRYELRNYHPPPGKTVARDLSKTLSPKSEAKAKHLILEYANTEDGERTPDSIELDFDHWPSLQPTGKPNSKKMNFIANLIKVIRGKSSQPQKNKSGETSPRRKSSEEVSYNYQRSGSSSQNSNDSLMDQNRLSSLVEEDPQTRMRLERRNSSGLDYFRSEGKCEEGEKLELAKYAEVLRDSRRVHKKSASAYI